MLREREDRTENASQVNAPSHAVLPLTMPVSLLLTVSPSRYYSSAFLMNFQAASNSEAASGVEYTEKCEKIDKNTVSHN